MFTFIYNIFCDGEYIAGFNDTETMEQFWSGTLQDHVDEGGNLEDHEYQVLALIKGAV